MLGFEYWIRWIRIALLMMLSPSVMYGQDRSTNSIDRLIEKDFEPLLGEPESAGLLLRRLSLDLRMVVPTSEELDAFLSDAAVDRWERWVKRFLDDPLHSERMVDWLDKTLMQRRPYQQVDRAKWLTYLRQAVDEQKPIDQIAKDLVSSVWWNQNERAKQRFFLERAGDPHAIARDIGRVFFGKDMQCAQCHDHPQVDDYLQIDYHGLLAYVSPSSFVEAKYKDDKGAEQKVQLYVERAARDAPFESVFDKGIFYRTGTRAPGGTEAFDPFETPDESYQASPIPESLEGVPAPPRFSRRNSLLAQLTAANRTFAINWSNRLWAMLMGKGLVHPLDMHHPDNPPTHPKLLSALTDSLIASGFQVRPVIEQIVLSDAYKVGMHMPIEASLRSSVVIDMTNAVGKELEIALISSELSLEAAMQPLKSAAEAAKEKCESAETEWKQVQKKRVELWAEIDKSEIPFNELLKKADAARVALEKAKKLFDDAFARQGLLDEATAKLEQAKSLGLADDAELKQAIATIKTKAESGKGLIPGLEKGIADATAAREASQMALDADRVRVKEVASKLTPIEQRLQSADSSLTIARSDWQKAQSEHVVALNQIADVRRIRAWVSASKAVPIAEMDLKTAEQSLERSKDDVSMLGSRIVLREKELAELRIARDFEFASLTQCKEEQNESSAQLSLLKNTVESIDKSLALVTSTEPLLAAKQSIQVSIVTLNAAKQKLESRCSEIAAELAQKQKGVETELGNLAKDREELARFEQHVAQGATSLLENGQKIKQAMEACSVAMQAVMEWRQKSGKLAITRPLSPEQLCLSIFQTTGVLKNYVAAESAELDKQAPLAEDATAGQRAARRVQATRQALDKLRSHLDTFANLYSSGAGQTSDDFFASPDQALYMSNGGSVFQWSAPSNSNISSLVSQQPDGTVASKLLFRSLMSREPTPDEEVWVETILSQAGEKKPAIVQELVWSLLSSAEFRLYP